MKRNRDIVQEPAIRSLLTSSVTNKTDIYHFADLQQRPLSESPDSGLPGDRSVRRIMIQLDRRHGQDLGLILAGDLFRSDKVLFVLLSEVFLEYLIRGLLEQKRRRQPALVPGPNFRENFSFCVYVQIH